MNQALAILWAQFRVFRNYSMKRGGMSFGLIVTVLWYGIWTLAAGVIAMVMADPDIGDMVTALPAGLLLVCLYWQLIPLLMATMGASLDIRKLQAYPIPASQLFSIELLLRVTGAVEMLLISVGAAVGILFNPTLPAWGALAVIPFILFNLLLSLGVRDLMVRLLARRRIREVVAIGFLALWIVPQYLAFRNSGADTVRGPGPRGSFFVALFQGNLWEGFPWTSTAHLLQGRDLLLSLPVITAWCAAAGVFAMWQFRRTLAFDPQAAGARGARPNERSGPLDGFYRLPSTILPDPLGALVEKELRYLARSPRFRMVFLMGCTFGIFVTRTMVRGGFGEWGPGYMTAATLYALLLLGEVCFWNTLGFDRSAAQIYFLAPVPFSRTLMAKNIAAGVYITIEILVMMAVFGLLRLPMDAYRVVEVFAVTAVVSVFLVGIGNMISVQNPRAANPQSSMRSNAAGRVQAIMFLIYPAAFLPAGLAYLAGWAFNTHVAFFAVLAIIGGIGAVVYKMTLEAAVERAGEQRETIIAALSQGDGPIAS